MLTDSSVHAVAVHQCVPGAVRLQQCSERLCTESIFAVLQALNCESALFAGKMNMDLHGNAVISQ